MNLDELAERNLREATSFADRALDDPQERERVTYALEQTRITQSNVAYFATTPPELLAAACDGEQNRYAHMSLTRN